MLSQQGILLISMILSGLCVLAYDKLVQSRHKKKFEIAMNRFTLLKKMEACGQIKRKIVHLEDDAEKAGESVGKRKFNLFNKRTRVIIHGESYTDKSYWFIMQDNVLFIIGKKNYSFIELHSEMFNN